MSIFVTRNGERAGPYPIEEIRRLKEIGWLRESDFAWSEGLPNWVPLSQVPGLATPPPPPPAAMTVPPPPAGPSNSELLLRRLVTAFVMFVVGFVVLYFVLLVVTMGIGGAIAGMQASPDQHPTTFDEGYKIGLEAGRQFREHYGKIIAEIDVLVALVLAALLSLGVAFSGLLPWCRKK